LLDLGSREAIPYLASKLNTDSAHLRVTPLGGGVSNTVVLAEAPGVRAVVKQALERLRVEQEWFCTRERIFNEVEGLRALGRVLPAGAVPEVLFEDREEWLFGMEAAPAGTVTLKDELLSGRSNFEAAAVLGAYLGSWVSATQGDEECKRKFGGLEIFDNLRLDPYYRATAQRHPELAPGFTALIEECKARRVALVHGDYSPKNVLLWGPRVTVIDFEVVHYGDPSFDAAFFTNHLVLKAFHQPEWTGIFEEMAERFWKALRSSLPPEFGWLEGAAMRHVGCLLLARVDGKSPAEYLRDAAVKQRVREGARALILDPPATAVQVFERLFA
jgi:5-methylthioribose kinase